MLSPLASLASEPYAIEENGKEIAHVLSPLASLASEPYVIEENGKEIAHVLSPLASLASEPYVIEENGKEIASVLSTRTLFTDLEHAISFKTNWDTYSLRIISCLVQVLSHNFSPPRPPPRSMLLCCMQKL